MKAKGNKQTVEDLVREQVITMIGNDHPGVEVESIVKNDDHSYTVSLLNSTYSSVWVTVRVEIQTTPPDSRPKERWPEKIYGYW